MHCFSLCSFRLYRSSPHIMLLDEPTPGNLKIQLRPLRICMKWRQFFSQGGNMTFHVVNAQTVFAVSELSGTTWTSRQSRAWQWLWTSLRRKPKQEVLEDPRIHFRSFWKSHQFIKTRLGLGSWAPGWCGAGESRWSLGPVLVASSRI